MCGGDLKLWVHFLEVSGQRVMGKLGYKKQKVCSLFTAKLALVFLYLKATNLPSFLQGLYQPFIWNDI